MRIILIPLGKYVIWPLLQAIYYSIKGAVDGSYWLLRQLAGLFVFIAAFLWSFKLKKSWEFSRELAADARGLPGVFDVSDGVIGQVTICVLGAIGLLVCYAIIESLLTI